MRLFLLLCIACLFIKGEARRKDCHDLWTYHHIRTSGEYQIDVDDDEQLQPFRVYCDMGEGTDVFQVRTIVHHDAEKPYDVWGKEQPGSFSRNVTYNNTTEAHLSTLIDRSFSCEQYIKWFCKGAMFGFWYPPGLNNWWVGRNWQDQFYWGGAETDSRSCGCHPYCQPTNRNSTCNCDSNDKQKWFSDHGLLLDKSRLPVLQLRFGDTGEANEAGRYTLGPLICRASAHKDIYLGSFTAPVTLTSPGYQNSYPPPFHRYTWHVTVPEGSIMELIFPVYDVLHFGAYNSVPGCTSVVMVNAERSSDGKDINIERQEKFPPYFITDGSETRINLTLTTCNQNRLASEAEERQGFMAELRQSECPGCEAGLGQNDSTTSCDFACGVIASYGYPYPHLTYETPRIYQHTWVLRVPPSHIVMLQFNDFDVYGTPGPQTCSPEWGVVLVYSGDTADRERLIGGFCNLNRQGVVYSKTNIMTVVFSTRFRKVGNGRGFHATFRQFSPSSAPKEVDFSTLKNVAQGKPSSQNTTFEDYSAQLAVDGNTDGHFTAGSCMSTQFIRDPWWTVNLQKQHLIYGIEIYNRVDKLPSSPWSETFTWPKGSYGLPMPVAGCPGSQGFEWKQGYRYHDIVYDIIENDKVSRWTDGMMLAGGVQEDGGVKQHFCMKTEDTTSRNATFWMPGSYCIYQYGEYCPPNFTSGYITWTDRQPSAGPSRNYMSGTVPKGRYTNHNTTIFFCCRNDGNPDVAIRLPTERPFFLLQLESSRPCCQKVQGMSVVEQTFYFAENRSAHLGRAEMDADGVPKFKEMHPRVDTMLYDKGLVLFYCYYDDSRSLRGFRVTVDSTGDVATFNRYYDENHHGIPHVTEKNFLESYSCADYPVIEPEQSVLRINCTQPVLGQYVTLQVYGRQLMLQFCEFKVFAKEACGQPLGMASEEIYDIQLQASSTDDTGPYHFTNARLNSEYGWCTLPNDPQKYIQIDLLNHTIITGVILQGLSSPGKNGYVEQFQLTFSNDSMSWKSEEEPVGRRKIYVCKQCELSTFNNDQHVRYNFLRGMVARYVRMKIIKYNRAPCLRLELIGCRSQVTCGAELSASDESVSSPNHPYYYGQDKNCWWNIHPPPGKHVWLSFIIFDLAQKESTLRAGSCQDELSLYTSYNESTVIRSPDGLSFPKEIISHGPMKIHLRTCFRYSLSRYRGFFATFKFADCPGCGMGDFTCSATHVCNFSCGHIFSIGYPIPYISNHRCRWLIHAPPSHYINVTFHDFDIPSAEHCSGDYIEFYDGNTTINSNLIGRFCNVSLPPRNIVSSWNYLLIEFSTDAEVSGRGFSISYTAEMFQLPTELQKLTFDNSQECPSSWKFYAEHCYSVYNETDPLQWYEAESKCVHVGRGRNGHLVSILDEKEMAVVHYFLTYVWKAHLKSLYIGLTDAAGEGFYRWSDGNPMSYSDWAHAGHGLSSQPDWVAYEDCTMLRVDSGHSTSQWHDIPCSLGKHSLNISSVPMSRKSNRQWNSDHPPPVYRISSYICKMRSSEDANDEDPQPLHLTVPKPKSAVEIAPEKYFVCKNQEVISVLNVCDGNFDCRDRSDESSNCGTTCPESSFKCKNHKCVSIGAYCDFKDDCGDNSDESQCDYAECKEDEFSCKNSQCIPMSKRCDLLIDCHDGTDEKNCEGKCNVNVTFQCYDGTCIPRNAVCDGHRDCPGKYHEDEQESCSREEDRRGLDEERRNCDNKPRKTCMDLYKQDGIRNSGYYLIDADGPEGPIMPFMVHCIMGMTEDDVRTVVHHDSETKIYVRSGVEGPGSYARPIVYNVGWDQMRTLINISNVCRQFVKWECSGTGFGYTQEQPISWWMSQDGEPQFYWGGARTNLSCGCYPNCQIKDARCNCDLADKFSWTEDSGYIEDREKLPIKEVRFGNTYKTGQAGYHIIGPLECFGEASSSEECDSSQNYLLCMTGHFVNISSKCLYGYDQFGYQAGCRDVSHLRGCENFDCPAGYVKCPKSYCIPSHYLCDGKWDCIGGADELDCANYVCSGQYKCNNQSSCVSLNQLCDGIRQCRHGDDELLCELVCPSDCVCRGHYVKCVEKNIVRLPKDLSKYVRKIDLSFNKLNIMEADFGPFTHLGELILQYNGLTTLPSEKFIQLKNLYLLDLRNNRIVNIQPRAFAGLKNVRYLYLENNPILSEIEPEAFDGLKQLTFLNLSGMALSGLKQRTFFGLEKVTTLNLKNNRIRYVKDGAFEDLNALQILDIQGNDIQVFSQDMFKGLTSLESLYSDSFKFCCLASPQVSFDACLPPADEISSCEDLMSSPVQRTFLWVLGVIALVGNIFVIVWRIKTKDTNKLSSILILSLGFADLLMGLYLIIIASVDIYYRGRYIQNSDHWRKSALCKICGFLSTLSSEVSIFTLVFITIDRLIAISFPFSLPRFSLKLVHRLIGASWLTAVTLAALPLMIQPYFQGEFYARSGVCLALHITNQKAAGWEYSVAIFFCVNLAAFVIIVSAYAYMYLSIRKSSTAVSRIIARQPKGDTTVARQMALIVLTNSLCWFPMIVMGLMAMSGVHIPGEAYAWTAVFVLPLNSATNPLVYTIASIRFHSFLSHIGLTHKRPSLTFSKFSMSLAHSVNGTTKKEQSHTRPFKPPFGYISLPQYLRTEPRLTPRHLLQIAAGICQTLCEVHTSGYALGGINMDCVFVSTIQDKLYIYLPDINAYRAGSSNDLTYDTALDMEEFGMLVKKMLRIYHVTSRTESYQGPLL